MKKLISENSGLFEGGVAAYNSKDYVTAAKPMQLSADQGYAEAQNILGVFFLTDEASYKIIKKQLNGIGYLLIKGMRWRRAILD